MKKIIIELKKLKKFGMIAVKQSLEDEGATFKDIELMRKITLILFYLIQMQFFIH